MRYEMIRCPIGMAALTLLPLLSSCALMGGGGKPVTMYQFGSAGEERPAPSVNLSQPVVIIYPGSTFSRESADDRIATANGHQTAYIAETRWVAPARELFDDLAVREIEDISPSIRVVRAGAPVPADYMLAIDVRQFKANYVGGPESSPEVVVDARAKLLRLSDKVIIGDWEIVQREQASENRVSAIVDAFDRAASSVSTKIAGHVVPVLSAS